MIIQLCLYLLIFCCCCWC